ncbi:conserved hypothetical protein [Ricinus communis]|uniref:Uncharacterized protein n=1 Tax=Ricinus communis TaxID=3988 RepID=B9S9X2_RICCO|nr:conserved hypothetical protein [Ricinus communis]
MRLLLNLFREHNLTNEGSSSSSSLLMALLHGLLRLFSFAALLPTHRLTTSILWYWCRPTGTRTSNLSSSSSSATYITAWNIPWGSSDLTFSTAKITAANRHIFNTKTINSSIPSSATSDSSNNIAASTFSTARRGSNLTTFVIKITTANRLYSNKYILTVACSI